MICAGEYGKDSCQVFNFLSSNQHVDLFALFLNFLINVFFYLLSFNQGDSGGPMVCYNADGSGYLGGIVR